MSVIRRTLQRIGIYNWVRYSRPYEFLLRWRNPVYLTNLQRDLDFYKKVLADKPVEVIFDIGANNGDKCWAFSRIARRVVCVEPDPDAMRALRARFGRQPGVTLVGVAAGRTNGQLTLHREAPGSAYNTLSNKHVSNQLWVADWKPLTVPVITLDVLIGAHGRPDFVKIDVEGFEIEVIRGLSQPIPVICFEANLPGFGQETLAVIDQLIALDPTYRFNVRQVAEYDFVFPAEITADDMKQFVMASGPQAYDLFAFQR